MMHIYSTVVIVSSRHSISLFAVEYIFLAMIQEWFAHREAGKSTVKLPEATIALAEFTKLDKFAKLILLGHSTLLLNIAGTPILVEPVSIITKRYKLLGS